MIYCSSTAALACLETLVHLSGAHPLPLNRYLVKIAIPPSAWRDRAVLRRSEHVGWDSQPCGIVSIGWGDDWVNSQGSLLAEVPSVIVPEETNILINPRHRDAKRLSAKKIRRLAFRNPALPV
jgi:RES domain-containing protein